MQRATKSKSVENKIHWIIIKNSNHALRKEEHSLLTIVMVAESVLFVIHWEKKFTFGKAVPICSKLPDKLSESGIPDNSSGIKKLLDKLYRGHFCSYRFWLRAKLARGYFSPTWRGVRFLSFHLFPIRNRLRNSSKIVIAPVAGMLQVPNLV